jgi:VanZ family protein
VISTLLAESPLLVRVFFVVAVVASTALGWLLHRAHITRALTVLVAIGLLGVLALTLSPASGRAVVFCTVQFSVPFQGIDTLANVAMVLPLALFAALRLGRPLAVFAAVSALSALIELFQALVPILGRACDTGDWLMNTVGAALGVLLAILIITVETRLPERKRRTLS